jgi:predicted transposase YbfD/YdcC
VWVSNEVKWVKLDDPWPHLGSIVAVESNRDVDGKVSSERRYYVSSMTGTDATEAAELVRGHWSVENNLHWQLDVTFNEDQRRIRSGYAAENFSRLCRMALNRIKQDKTTKGSMRVKRLRAAWDDYYLFKLLTT